MAAPMPAPEGLSEALPVVYAQAPARARARELVVVSGKGGTGKTSVVASFAVLAGEAVVADCDVDAADLHLVLKPQILETERFASGHDAVIRQDDCDGCGLCEIVCRFDAVVATGGVIPFVIDPLACEGCGVCVELCPLQAIDFNERICGEWFSSQTRTGPMVHARLGIAAENSGKLVSLVRTKAADTAAHEGKGLILTDGPPGIGCPVIAAITGAAGVLIVTEPTVSGAHDMERVLELAGHFGIPAAVCVNRWDINPECADDIEARARNRDAAIVGRIRYDAAVTRAQVEGRTVVELGGAAAEDIRAVWEHVQRWMEVST
jgi:MinD superfamily P-loop ATPase